MARLAAMENEVLTEEQVDMTPQVSPLTATPKMRSSHSKRLEKLPNSKI